MKLDGIYTLSQLEERVNGLGKKADPNFKNWLYSLAPMERRYVLGYLLEIFGVRPND